MVRASYRSAEANQNERGPRKKNRRRDKQRKKTGPRRRLSFSLSTYLSLFPETRYSDKIFFSVGNSSSPDLSPVNCEKEGPRLPTSCPKCRTKSSGRSSTSSFAPSS